MNQGQEANISGKYLENMVERTFKDLGYEIKTYNDDRGVLDMFMPKLLLRNVPFTNLFGGTSRTEFVAMNEAHERKLRIECKAQEVPGSTEEKLVYFYLNAIRCMPENEAMLFYGGEFFNTKSRAIEWIKNAAKVGLLAPNQNKHIHVIGMAELRRFVRDWDKGTI